MTTHTLSAYQAALRHDRVTQAEARLSITLPADLRALICGFNRSGSSRRAAIQASYALSQQFVGTSATDPVNFEWAVWLGHRLWSCAYEKAMVVGRSDPFIEALAQAVPAKAKGTVELHLEAATGFVPAFSETYCLFPLRLGGEAITFSAERRDRTYTAKAVHPVPPRPDSRLPTWVELAHVSWINSLPSVQYAFALAVRFEIEGWDVKSAHLSNGTRGLLVSRAEQCIVLSPEGRVGSVNDLPYETRTMLKSACGSLIQIKQLCWTAQPGKILRPARIDRDGTLWCET